MRAQNFTKALLTFVSVFALATNALAASARGNTTNESYVNAKRLLDHNVYFDHRVTLYCEAPFDWRRNITLPRGFTTPSDANRARRVEWEHVVPAENFGREFTEWKYGSSACFDNGKHFRGRNCAERANREFRLMHADMYNLFPSIGAVNKLRSNFPYTEFSSDVKATFGTCQMKIRYKKAEPPEASRGEIARAVLYMAWAYPERIRLKSAYIELMKRWDARYKASAWECLRAKRIKALQGNANPFTEEACKRRNK